MSEEKQLSPLTKYIYWLKGKLEYDPVCDNLSMDLCISLDEPDMTSCRITDAYVNKDRYLGYSLPKDDVGNIIKKLCPVGKITYIKTVHKLEKENELRRRFPMLKNDEIVMLMNMNSDLDELFKDDKIKSVKPTVKRGRKKKTA